MSDGRPLADQPIAQATVTVPQDHHMLVVRVQRQTWVTVSTEEREIVTERSPDPILGFVVAPGTYIVRTDGEIESAISEASESLPSSDKLLPVPPALMVRFSALRLSAEAPNQHIVDGVGEVPADGIAFCTITVEKVTPDGTALTGKEHKDEFFMRTTGGVLMDAQGKERIRSLKLKSGRATFRLVSETNPRLVTVSAFGRDPFLSRAEIQIEFV
jgi:hypothetical protein